MHTRSLPATALALALTFGPACAQQSRPAQADPSSQPPAERTAPAESGERANAPQPTLIPVPQPLGTFPTNERSALPLWRPDGDEEGYRKTVSALQRTLTDLQQLQLQTKQAHWNVSGTLFQPLHEMLQEQYEELSKQADTVAERLLAVGASVDGRANTIVRGSTLPEFPGGWIDDAQVIVWFTYAYKAVGEAVHQSIKDSEEPDPTSSNLLQEVKHKVDKFQWQMRAHLQRTRTNANDGRDINDGRAVELPPAPPRQGAR